MFVKKRKEMGGKGECSVKGDSWSGDYERQTHVKEKELHTAVMKKYKLFKILILAKGPGQDLECSYCFYLYLGT